MNTEKRNFDLEAAAWDQNPGRVKVASDISRAILNHVAPSADMDVLDFGCGTGLLTLAIQPFVHTIHGVDSSQGMIDVLEKKVREQGLTNVTSGLMDADRSGDLTGSFDLITSSMTLHHLADVDSLLHDFHRILKPSGMVALADLDAEGGLFHSDNTGVFHFGFDRKALQSKLENAHFNGVLSFTAADVEKPVEGQTRRFTIFLITAKRA